MRLHLAPTTLVALPLHAPDDPAIESAKGREILARDGQTVSFMAEKQFLQREIKDDVPGWLNATAYTAVIATWLALVLFFGWCYGAAARRPDVASSPRESVPV